MQIGLVATVKLALTDDPLTPAEAAPWIGPLVALGARASRYADTFKGRQLVIAISVPRRDFASALIGCGWVMASSPPTRQDPLTVLRRLAPRTLVRIVTARHVIIDFFDGLDETTTPPRAHIGGSQWKLSGIRAVRELSEPSEPMKMPRPSPGPLGALAGVQDTWDERLAAPAADLVLVGTQTWLRQELEALVSRVNVGHTINNGIASDGAIGKVLNAAEDKSLGSVLLPEGSDSATWFTRLYSSAQLADLLPLPLDVRAVVLDGAGATKYLAEIEAPIVVCVLDRSVADETAAEIVIQIRNSYGEPLSIRSDLGWAPPAGIEVLAFTVPM